MLEFTSFDAILLVLIGLSLIIWLGVAKKWAVREEQYDNFAPFVPWATLGFVFVRVMTILGALGVPIQSLPTQAKLILVVVPICLGPIIGIWASIVRWPRWLLPPWYHEYREQHRAQAKDEDRH